MSDQEFVVVFQSSDPLEMEMAKGLLEQADIPFAVSAGSSAAYVTAVLGSHFGGFQTLAVPASEEERALGVFEDAWGQAPGEEGSG